jgi:hypothetical protein
MCRASEDFKTELVKNAYKKYGPKIPISEQKISTMSGKKN